MIPIIELVNTSIKEQNDKREKKNQISWHASSLGTCLRGTYLNRLGNKPDKGFDERTLRVFNMGNLIEDWLVDLLKLQELKFGDMVIETQVRGEDKELNVSGYADVVVEYQGEKEVIEIKSKHSRAFWWMNNKGEGAQRQHQYQLWLYLWMLKIDKGRITYVSKDDLSILEYPVLRSNETLKKEVFEQLELLNKAWQSKDPTLLPLPINGIWGNKNDWQQKYCGWHKQCLKL